MRRAIFAGTFDPVTNGHLDLVERALVVFDGLLVAVAAGHHKTTFFSHEDRVQMFREASAQFANVEVVSFGGLLVDLARAQGIHTVVRGLRVVSDFEHEYQMALMNRKLDRTFETVFLMPSARYVFLNSSLVKEVGRFGGSLEGLVPDVVLRRFAALAGKRGDT